MIECNSILWASGNTGLVWWNTPGFESHSGERIIYLEAGSHLFHSLISDYITGTDRRARLDASFNTRYAVKYYVFAQILALCRARIITNPIRQIQSDNFIACLIVRIVV
jgi:hypothetical protein